MRRLSRLLCVLVVMASTVVLTPIHSASAAAPIRVYIFAGQSNMVGTATAASQIAAIDPSLAKPPPNVQFWGPTSEDPSRWGPLEAPTVVFQAMTRHGFGPEISAAHDLVTLHPTSRIAIIKYAWGSTNLHTQWNPRHNTLYRGLLDDVRYSLARLRAQTGLPTRVSGIFWMQGESDSDTRAHARAYGRNLTNFIASLRRDFHAPNVSFVVGQIDDVRTYTPGLPYSNIVRAQQASVARHVRNVHLVSTKGLQHSPISRIHFSSKGTIDLGKRFVRGGWGL